MPQDAGQRFTDDNNNNSVKFEPLDILLYIIFEREIE